MGNGFIAHPFNAAFQISSAGSIEFSGNTSSIKDSLSLDIESKASRRSLEFEHTVTLTDEECVIIDSAARSPSHGEYCLQGFSGQVRKQIVILCSRRGCDAKVSLQSTRVVLAFFRIRKSRDSYDLSTVGLPGLYGLF